MRAGRLGQAGQRRLEGQFLGPPGVHPAEQRVNEPVHDLLAEPGRHVTLHRHVAVPVRGGQPGLLAGPLQPFGREEPGPAQLPDIRGHAHVLPGGQPVHRPPAPDPGRGGPRRPQVITQAGRPDQSGALGPAGQQRLSAYVNPASRDLGQGQLPAGLPGPLQHDDPDRLVTQEERRREPGDPGSDDRDHWEVLLRLLHAFTLRVRLGHRVRLGRAGTPPPGGGSG